MLYECWHRVAKDQWHERAVRDTATGQQLTFGELFQRGESFVPDAASIAFPQNHSLDFILTILGAWRSGQVVCPLEQGQPKPVIQKPPAQCVHLKITSATSGRPRMVAMTAAQLKADADNIIDTMGLRREWPNLGVVSLAHSYGFSNLILPLLLHGIPLILTPSPLPEIVRLAAEKEQAITLPAVPALWRTWHDAGLILPNLKKAISSGAPLPVALERDIFDKSDVKIHNFYGSSECGGIAYDTTETPRTDNAFAGTLLKNVTVDIQHNGCLEIRSQAVGETYWPEPNDKLGNRKFQTEDLAEIQSGALYLRGRAGDVINVAGRKVAPEYIEQFLRSHPQVRDCLVFGVPDSGNRRTDKIVAVVALRKKIKAHELQLFMLQSLFSWQVPRQWWFVDSIQADGRGKTSRAQWREKFLESNE